MFEDGNVNDLVLHIVVSASVFIFCCASARLPRHNITFMS